jgi:hypothetical protein
MSRRRTSDNLANEIEAHLELETQRLIEEGDARRPSAPAPAVLSYRVWHTLFEVRPVAGLPIPAAIIVVTAAAATSVPSRRALRISPATLLRT